MARTRVAVLFGGRSVEHEISIISALQLIEAVDTSRFEVVPVYIAQDGRWFVGEKLLQKSFYRNMPAALDELDEVTLLPVPNQKGLQPLSALRRGFSLFGGKNEQIAVDVFLPAFHGTMGEDGCIPGTF